MFSELFWQSHDGLRLYTRVYDTPDPAAPTVLCLPGLRRNSRDFEDLALHLQPRYSVIAPDLRGRGQSARDRYATNYQPNVYVQDVLNLLAQINRPRVVVLGTALGGIIGMMLALAQPGLVTGLILNDIGPEVDAAGAERVRGLVADRQMPRDWVEASQCLKDLYNRAWPDLTTERWLSLARRTFREDSHGGLVLDCDPMVADLTWQCASSSSDLWPLWAELRDLPILTVHGILSDILTRDIVARMADEHPGMAVCELSNRGHFPLLDEPPALLAIDRYLDSLPTISRRACGTAGLLDRWKKPLSKTSDPKLENS